jgi:IucA/IucC family protein
VVAQSANRLAATFAFPIATRRRARKLPNTSPGHYLLSPVAARAALKKLSFKYPHLAKWIYCEQKLNNRTVPKGDYPIQPTSVPADFWPELQPVFWLAEFEAPRDLFYLFHNAARSLPWYFCDSSSETYSHLVHPLSARYFLSRKMEGAEWKSPRFLATPTASHRTLLVWDPEFKQPPFAVKTSVNLWIGGLNRNLRISELKRSVGMSSLLAGVAGAELARQGILLLEDPSGLVHKQTNAGLLARDTPANLNAEEEIVPVFSLLAAPNGGRPRILDLVAASGLEATTWVDEFVFKPLLYQAYFLGITEGLVGEMHEQNVLMELRSGVPTKRFWHRDFGGFGIDPDLRRLANKGFDNLPAGIRKRSFAVANCSLLHRVVREYLQESIGYAVGYALRNHFEVPPDDFANLYNVRAAELQNLIFAANGIRTTRNYEKDLERYRKRKRGVCTWCWNSQQEALRDWR